MAGDVGLKIRIFQNANIDDQGLMTALVDLLFEKSEFLTLAVEGTDQSDCGHASPYLTGREPECQYFQIPDRET